MNGQSFLSNNGRAMAALAALGFVVLLAVLISSGPATTASSEVDDLRTQVVDLQKRLAAAEKQLTTDLSRVDVKQATETAVFKWFEERRRVEMSSKKFLLQDEQERWRGIFGLGDEDSVVLSLSDDTKKPAMAMIRQGGRSEFSMFTESGKYALNIKHSPEVCGLFLADAAGTNRAMVAYDPSTDEAFLAVMDKHGKVVWSAPRDTTEP